MEPGHRAFKFNKVFGVQETVYREGWHVKMPYFEKPIIYDVRTHPKQIKSVTGSKGKSKFPSRLLLISRIKFVMTLIFMIRFANGEHLVESLVQA